LQSSLVEQTLTEVQLPSFPVIFFFLLLLHNYWETTSFWRRTQFCRIG